MKRFVFLLLAFCLGTASTMYAQNKEAEKAAKKAQKEAKKAEKAARKAAEEAAEMALFEQCVKAMENKDFVVAADRVEFKRGQFVDVNSSTNFVLMKGDQASIQLAFNGPGIGVNGMGGITVDGRVSGVEMQTDKKGNVTFEMMVQGTAVSASITIRMAKGTNHCSATVTPNFNSNRISFTGDMQPGKSSTIFKGRPL